MNIIQIDRDIALGVEQFLLKYLKANGSITNLEEWAFQQQLNPKWVRTCAHSAADKGLIKIEQLPNLSGRPVRVTLLEEGT
jgi:hypothetical protein